MSWLLQVPLPWARVPVSLNRCSHTLWVNTQKRVAGHVVTLLLMFLRKHQAVFHGGCTRLRPPSVGQRPVLPARPGLVLSCPGGSLSDRWELVPGEGGGCISSAVLAAPRVLLAGASLDLPVWVLCRTLGVRGEPPTACDAYDGRCSRVLAPALGTCRVSAVRLDGSPFLRVRCPPWPLVAFLELTLILPDVSMAAPASFRTLRAGCQRPLPTSLSSLELGRV